jgi:zinc-finger of transposase IS204/IS1001/IS1096/IS1165
MAKPTLLPDATCLHLKLLDASEAAITAVVTTISEEAECPLCHRRSTRIHSRYVRSVADLPWMGCAVRLELHVRRFFCPNPEYAQQIFSERLPNVVAPYARRTTRLTDVFIMYNRKSTPFDLFDNAASVRLPKPSTPVKALRCAPTSTPTPPNRTSCAALTRCAVWEVSPHRRGRGRGSRQTAERHDRRDGSPPAEKKDDGDRLGDSS